MEEGKKLTRPIDGLVHEAGNMYHMDVFIHEESILNDTSFRLSTQMIEHKIRIIRSENYFIYKIEELDDLPYGVGMGYRISCVRLGQPKVILRKKLKAKLGALN